MAENHGALSASGGSAEQPLVVGVAADDTMQHDDVCRLDGLRGAGEVHPQGPRHASAQPRLVEEPRSFGLVRGRELDVGGVRRAPLERLELDVADPTTDLEQRRAVETQRVGELEHELRARREPLAPVSLREAAREPGVELAIESVRCVRRTALVHGFSIAAHRCSGNGPTGRCAAPDPRARRCA
ncbi:hypothetical protein B1729_10820 [Microbacterium sp. B35-04]|nr:hypothetical protein B1729_10820 [Microbacterium sp. B35-04]